MADKHGLNCDVRELKLGASFTSKQSPQYHTIKYDFKPASVDVNKMATVDVGTNNQVTVTVPHLDGTSTPHTVFKGSQRPYAKECVLIIDRVTGEITLEKLSSNIQVKKTRQESASKPRPLTPVTSELTNTTQRSTSRTRVATNRRAQPPPPPPHHQHHAHHHGGASAGAGGGVSGAGAGAGAGAALGGRPTPRTPPTMVRSPGRVKNSPPQAPNWWSGGHSTQASLPMIGLDEPLGGAASPPAHPVTHPATHATHPAAAPTHPASVPHLPSLGSHHTTHAQLSHQSAAVSAAAAASSSSSSSDSGSDSDSNSDSEDERPPRPSPAPPAPHAGNTSVPADVLNEDLCLSESGSESD